MENTGYKIIKSGYVDFSDYARRPAVFIAKSLKSSPVRAYQLTLFHFAVFILAVYLIAKGHVWWGSVLILIKNVLDASDGSLARLQNRPSRVGRFLDSNLDFLGNFLLFAFFPGLNIWEKVTSFLSFSLQGTFFNYYSILFRTGSGGDSTSKIKEGGQNTYPYDNPVVLKIMLFFYRIFYAWQDKIAHWVDKGLLGSERKVPSARFASIVSVNGLGFQYLIIILGLLLHTSSFVFFYFSVLANIFLFMLLILRKFYS